jgi:polyisoprenoid-binding protein YceI
MNNIFILLCGLFIINYSISAQSFKVKAEDTQKFVFNDKITENQISFSSSTSLEDVNGTASSISGTVSFNNSNFEKTLKSKFTVSVKSLNTGIELRNHHLQSANWLDASKYPDISFELISISDLKQVADNKLAFNAKGNFTLHGVTKEIVLDAEAIYLKENDQTQKKAPGDLLGISAKFKLNLSDYNVDNQLVGNRVAEKIEVKVIIVGSNKL